MNAAGRRAALRVARAGKDTKGAMRHQCHFQEGVNMDEKLLRLIENPNCYFILRIGKRVQLALISPEKRTAIHQVLDFKKEEYAAEVEEHFKQTGGWK